MVRRTGNLRPVVPPSEQSGYEKEKKRKKHEEEDKEQGAALFKLFKKIKERSTPEEGNKST